MLTEPEINQIIAPFTERQHALEQYVIRLISERVNEIGRMLPSDIHKLERLYRTGSDVRLINKAIADMTGLQVNQIKKMIKMVAGDAYKDAKPYYDYRHITQIPLEQNETLQRTIMGVSTQTSNTFKNLSNTQTLGFVLRDRKHPKRKRFYKAADAYTTIIDEAIQAVQTGTIDYNTAMRNTMRQLNDSGMKRFYWDSGYTQRADTAVKRNILDAIKQISQKTHEILGKQFGATGYEITAHPFPAPDHAPFQGHLVNNRNYDRLQNNKSFKDTDGNKFPAQKRILGQYNCKHFAYPIILGVSRPKYTKEQLQDMLDQNEKGATLPDGTHLTGYEALQMQNQLALKVREYKDAQMNAKASGDDDLAREFQAKVNKATKQYNLFNKKVMTQLGLSQRKDKLRVTGYVRISAK